MFLTAITKIYATRQINHYKYTYTYIHNNVLSQFLQLLNIYKNTFQKRKFALIIQIFNHMKLEEKIYYLGQTIITLILMFLN